MEATNVASWATFQEVLTKDNYEIWKTLMKNYLQGGNLWDAVEASDSSSDSSDVNRRMNAKAMNAKALYIIQQSCGPKILDKIIRCETAQEAWNKLAAHYGSESKAELDIEQGVVEDDFHQFKELYDHVEEGNWTKVESFIRNTSNALFWAGSSGRTVLHFATLAGHVNIVEGLVRMRMGGDKLVQMQDNQGYTALALAARYTGNTDVAKCMVENKDGAGVRKDLLAIKNESGDIPLLLAADNGHNKMTGYLYENTPRDVLKGQDSSKRVYLLERCIKEQIYNVALRLLQDFPDLPIESISKSDASNGFLGLKELAQTPTAFSSACQLGPLQRFIYHVFRVHRLQDNSNDRNTTAIVRGDIRHTTNFLRLRKYGLHLNTVNNRNTTAIVRGDRRHTANFLRRALTKICCAFFFPVFKFLKNFGIGREIYEQELIHYEVLQILLYFKLMLTNSELEQASVRDAMLDAAKYGIVEFINVMAWANYNLVCATDNRKRGIFSYAVLYRKLNVFQLIQTLNGRKDIVKNSKDVFGNNLLHLAGHKGHSSQHIHRQGAALQMQLELQWFKAVEEIVHPKCKEARNDDNKKPSEVFSETHEQLVKDGEKWAKESAQSFSIVGTLITTIMFAAAFTVPGGNGQDTGVPILLNEDIFTVFVVADAISLFTSATSVLIFIWILTSRFSEKDFLKRFPCKLLFGLFFLVLSVASMVFAFGAALAIVIKKYSAYKQLFIGGAILACVPVTVLVPSQLRLIYEIFRSTISNPIRR